MDSDLVRLLQSMTPTKRANGEWVAMGDDGETTEGCSVLCESPGVNRHPLHGSSWNFMRPAVFSDPKDRPVAIQRATGYSSLVKCRAAIEEAIRRLS